MSMPNRPWRVFVSHTSELRRLPAGGSFVDAAQEAIVQEAHAVVDMKYFTASETPPATICQQAVTESDVYVAIVGFRYGSPVRDKPTVSYTELEFEAAGSVQIPRLIFLLGDATLGPRELFIDTRYEDRQQQFRRRLCDSGVTTRTVGSPQELQIEVLRALHGLGRVAPVSTKDSDEWSFIHAAIGRRISAVMVDVMRLLMVRSSPLSYKANGDRYEEFVQIADQHFEDLRSNIAALSVIGDARQYEKSREIELRFLWLLRSFATKVSKARIASRELGFVREAMAMAYEFIHLYPGVVSESFDVTLELVRRTSGPRAVIDRDPDSALLQRHSAQTRVKAMHGRDVGPGITMDIDNQLAVRYLAVDWWLVNDHT
jgi:hypothetical protein